MHRRATGRRPPPQHEVLTWGWGCNGQLGHGDVENRIMPQGVAQLHRRRVIDIVCGSRFTLALTRHGTVYSWGRADDGQLGHGNQQILYMPRSIEGLEGTRVVQIAARGAHSMALDSEGVVHTWGRGDDGQLGHGTTRSRSIPRPVVALQVRAPEEVEVVVRRGA